MGKYASDFIMGTTSTALSDQNYVWRSSICTDYHKITRKCTNEIWTMDCPPERYAFQSNQISMGNGIQLKIKTCHFKNKRVQKYWPFAQIVEMNPISSKNRKTWMLQYVIGISHSPPWFPPSISSMPQHHMVTFSSYFLPSLPFFGIDTFQNAWTNHKID